MKRLLLIALFLPLLATAQQDSTLHIQGLGLAPWVEVEGRTPITNDDEIELTGKLINLWHADSVTMAFVILHNLPDNVPIEDYARDYGRKYHIGDHNGVIFVVALKEHLMRMEVADQLEGIFPDITCKEITDLTAGYFKHGDYERGLETAIEQVDTDIKAAGGIHKLPPPSTGKFDILFAILSFISFGGIVWLLSLVVKSHEKKKREEDKKNLDNIEEELNQAIRNAPILDSHDRFHTDMGKKYFHSAPPPPGPPPPCVHRLPDHEEDSHGHHGYREEHPIVIVPDSTPSYETPTSAESVSIPDQSPDFGNSGFDGGGATSSW